MLKVIVYAHRLEVGGTQTNAIELAAAVRDKHGWEVVLFAQPGPMEELVSQKGLRFVPAPDARFHPSLKRMMALRELVISEGPDLIHTWDWWQCLDAFYGVHLPMRIPMIVSDMMMDLTRIIPKGVPTTFGVPELVDRAKASGRGRAELLLPPVDVEGNAPGVGDGSGFRRKYQLAARDIVVVTVSRLSNWMKGESLERTVRAVGQIGRDLSIRLVVVGEGGAREGLDRLAREVNSQLGRTVVAFAGALLDPRPAYAGADIVVGMGGSALRGMAFAKPVIVVGEGGFAELLSPDSADRFLYSGMYGKGTGSPSVDNLVDALESLVGSKEMRIELGNFARAFVTRHYSLETVSADLARFYAAAAREPIPLRRMVADGLRTAGIYLRERRFLTPSRDRRPKDEVVRL